MKAILLNTDQKIKSIYEDEKREVVSLLIAEKNLRHLTEKEKKTLIKNFVPLIRKYEKYLISTKRIHNKAGKILYNREQSPLKKINLRMKNSDWNLLSLLASTHGVSRSFLMNYILWLDKVGIHNFMMEKFFKGTSNKIGSYQFNWRIQFQSNQLIRELIIEPNLILVSSLKNKRKDTLLL
ncbi:DUF1564 family protein [Leptospira gomenensis]|uniref:DUF1564 family protein n=1 Tax=Leptospira gomenensis TaxID=2484974 RepID=A0A5F1YCC7_9LEPT|nr:DUF1564 family protein [Leptospira gomenensis]TGK34601.1 DUF1564 family protein [Leptospira gomenensis]TGK40089.1 DUF1564 family protein [Leptospira gomenensis]TGK40501.1 DUF1564 family protein [Leptospira gomenensis]TGK55598.1 DUF1564 family protein [Leptospira gomenensis]